MAASVKEMERKIEELSLSIRRRPESENAFDSESTNLKESKTIFQQTKNRAELIDLLKNLSPEASKFQKIQHALLVSTMPFFVDEETGAKYNLLKPEERLLGGDKHLLFTIRDTKGNNFRYRATLKDGERYNVFARKTSAHPHWQHDWHILKKKVPSQWKNFYFPTEVTLIKKIPDLKISSSTIDRQGAVQNDNHVVTHYNISYQAGGDNGTKRHSYGVAYVDKYAKAFGFTSGSYVKRAIEESVKDSNNNGDSSYRYKIDVMFDIYDFKKEEWKNISDERSRQVLSQACNMQISDDKRQIRESIRQIYAAIRAHEAMLQDELSPETRIIILHNLECARATRRELDRNLSSLQSDKSEYASFEYRTNFHNSDASVLPRTLIQNATILSGYSIHLYRHFEQHLQSTSRSVSQELQNIQVMSPQFLSS